MRYIVDDAAFTIEPLDPSGDAALGVGATSWFDDAGFASLSRWWTQSSWQRKYSYQFNWLGRPLIQLPADVMLMQEIIWRARPDVIVETGIAHGGSVVLHASLLRMVHGEESHAADRPHVIAIDIDIRPQNRSALEQHPMRSLFTLIEGDSTDAKVNSRVRQMLRPADRVMVVLDSNHTRSHVSGELKAFSPIVSPGCAMVVMDGIMPDLARLPDGQREWAHDHPGLAIADFLKSPIGSEFTVDRTFEGYTVTHSPGGVLMRRANHGGDTR